MHKKPFSNIYNPDKNLYHQQPGVAGKTYIHAAYSLDLICNEGLRAPHLAVVEYNARGKVIKTLIEIKFNVNVGFVNQTDPLPSGSIVRLEFIPASEYRGNRCDGKPQVLLHVQLLKTILLCIMANQEYFTTSEKVSRIGSSTQDSSILQREKMQDFSLTTGPTFPHTPNVQYLNVTAVTLQPPNRGELGDLPPTPETQELQARGELGDLLSKDQIKDNPPNQDHMDFPPCNCRRGTRSPSQTIHPIRTTGTSPPAFPGGGQGPHPGQSTQSGQQGLPPQHFQEGDKVPIPDNPPNQDNRDFPPSISGGGQGPHPGQSTQSGQQGLPPPAFPGGGQEGLPPPNMASRRKTSTSSIRRDREWS